MKKILAVHTLIEPTIEDLINMRKKIEKTFGKVKVITNMIAVSKTTVIVYEEGGERFVVFQ